MIPRRRYSVRAYSAFLERYTERGRYFTRWGADRIARRMNRKNPGWVVEVLR